MAGLQIRRVLLQTLILIQKNLLIALKKPISTFISTLLLPIALALIFCYLKRITPLDNERHQSGFSHESQSVRDLAEAMAATSSRRLVFVTNGISDQRLTGLIRDLRGEPGMEDMDVRGLSDIDQLLHICPQTIQGTSDCFASVIFDTFDDARVNYTIAVSSNAFDNTPLSLDRHQSLLSNYVAPLQWAINSRLGGLDDSFKPRERLWDTLAPSSSFDFGPLESDLAAGGAFWLQLVQQFIAPLFVFIFIGATHHISKSVASERDLAELMAAQRITLAPRILSNILSFIALYLPGWVACSVLFPKILFGHTSGGVFFILTVLCGISLITASHLVASFFKKPSVAAMSTSVLLVALAIIYVASTLQYDPSGVQIKALALCFPPTTWATLISETAAAEIRELTSYSSFEYTGGPVISDSLYAAFFIVQIVFYFSATFLVETLLWNVPRQYDTLDPAGAVAVRVTNLSKTYRRPRKWYWPFSRSLAKRPAVNDVSFDVREGGITFLLGPNGGGKTSLLKCITGMVSPDVPSKIALKPGHDVFGICPQNNVSPKAQFPSLLALRLIQP
jgi:ABC-type multidrug transport system fused ATPase/permease subunit